jgi:SSS family solute:Na+ symporter
VGEVAGDQIFLPTYATVVLAIVLASYLSILTGLSLFAGRKVETQEDYLVAGRKLSLFFCWATMVATWFGAEAMTAASENARREGMLGVILDPLACAATFIFAGFFFAAPLWRMKLVTTSDFFRRTYGPSSEILSSWIQVPSYFGWIALQFQALADVQKIYFGIPYGWGLLIACGVTAGYTMIGGMWSVTLTESFQILIALTGLVMLAWSTFSQFGEGSVVAGVQRLIQDSEPGTLTLLPPAATAAVLAYFGAWATGILGNVPGQDMQQRIFSARDERTAVRACLLTGVTYFCFGMLPVGIGLVSRIVQPEGYETGTLQMMVNRYLSPLMAVAFILAFTSMVIATSTSAILAPATILSHSLLGRWAVFRNRGLILDRASVVLIALGGLGMTQLQQTKMQLLDLSISLTLVALFVPLWRGLYGRPRSEWSAILSMSLGLGFYLLRWMPENMLFAMPDNLNVVTPDGLQAVEYHDFIAHEIVDGFTYPRVPGEEFTALPKLSVAATFVRGLLIVPADWYGLAASLAGYLIGQFLFAKRPPVNEQTLKDAWGERSAQIAAASP